MKSKYCFSTVVSASSSVNEVVTATHKRQVINFSRLTTEPLVVEVLFATRGTLTSIYNLHPEFGLFNSNANRRTCVFRLHGQALLCERLS